MKLDVEYNNIQTIPRWLSHCKSKKVNCPNILTSDNPSEYEIINHNNLIEEWKENKTLSYAIQLVASSETLGLKDNIPYKEALFFLKSKRELFKDNKLLTNILGDYDDNQEKEYTDNTQYYRDSIRDIKIKLLFSCRDSVLWTDLAYFYTISGNRKKAEKCIRTAISLNNYNSHIIRSAARYYIYCDNPEKALYIIRNSPNVLQDPLVLSSEIAISEAFKLKSFNIKKGKILLQNDNIPKCFLSELNSTIATIECNHGNLKRGKRYINNALEDPNENALAQIQFLAKKNDIVFSPQQFDIPCRYEADAWNYFYSYNYVEAATESQKWFNFHPFSTRPAILNSFIRGTFLDQHEEAISIIDQSLKLSPNSSMLLNNKAFSLAKIGKVDEARECIGRIDSQDLNDFDNTDITVLKATSGLIEYRSDNPIEGNRLYKEATEYLKAKKDFVLEARALYFWSLEESRFNPIEAEKIKAEANTLAHKYKIQEVITLLKKNTLKIEGEGI
jgi:hypothetical protein